MFKVGDLIKLKNIDDATINIALYKAIINNCASNICWVERKQFENTIGEVIQDRQYEYLIWWPTLDGYNFFSAKKLISANENNDISKRNKG